MALDGNTLGLLMMGNVNSLSDAEKRDRSAVFRAMGRAVVDHIKANAELGTLIFFGGTAGATLAYVPPTGVPVPPAPPAVSIPLLTIF